MNVLEPIDNIIDEFLSLNSSPKTKTEILKVIHSLGIYTIQDFLKFPENNFPQNTKKRYIALRELIKSFYLNQELIFEDILEKTYLIRKNGIKEFIQDLRTLGFEFTREYALSMLFFYMDEHPKLAKSFTMKEMIKNWPYLQENKFDFRKFYVRYYELTEMSLLTRNKGE